MIHRAYSTSLTRCSHPTTLPITRILNPTPHIVVNEPLAQCHTIHKNGREFHAWHAGKYPFPCDRAARDNEDILLATTHQFCYGTGGFDDSLLEHVLIAPLMGGESKPKKILDMGCGSGLFIAGAAQLSPNTTFVGVDLVGGQDMLVRARDLASACYAYVADSEGTGNFRTRSGECQIHFMAVLWTSMKTSRLSAWVLMASSRARPPCCSRSVC